MKHVFRFCIMNGFLVAALQARGHHAGMHPDATSELGPEDIRQNLEAKLGFNASVPHMYSEACRGLGTLHTSGCLDLCVCEHFLPAALVFAVPAGSHQTKALKVAPNHAQDMTRDLSHRGMARRVSPQARGFQLYGLEV